MTSRTSLYQAHIDLQADMTDFLGFDMPIRYKSSSIVDEHMAVRENVGMFDTSHMGRYWITGKDTKEFLNYLVPRDISTLHDGMAGYTMILNEMGGIKDDVIVYQLKSDEFLLVCNAGNRQKIWNWIDSFAKLWKLAGKDFNIEDKSDTSCMIAVQGPRVENIMKDLTSDVLPDKRFRIAWISIGDTPVLCSTTGYTGEAGYELMVFADIDTINEKAIALWNQLLVKKVVPCALGSRDTLRLESGYCLYGNDMDETTHLLETGLDFFPFVKIDKTSGFVGQDAVLSFKDKVDKIRVGFKLLAKGIARHGYKVFVDDKEVGWVASGTQSPITKEPIGMAYVPITHKEKGSLFQIEIRNKKVDAEVIDFPTFDTTKYGLRRQL